MGPETELQKVTLVPAQIEATGFAQKKLSSVEFMKVTVLFYGSRFTNGIKVPALVLTRIKVGENRTKQGQDQV